MANTGAIIRGLNRPGTAQMVSPYVPPQSDARMVFPAPGSMGGSWSESSSWSVQDRLVRADTGQVLTGNVNPRLPGSALFGRAVLPLLVKAVQS